MPDGDDHFTSLAQASFDAQRNIFLHEFRRFLASPATPAPSRAEEAAATLSAVKQIIELSGFSDA